MAVATRRRWCELLDPACRPKREPAGVCDKRTCQVLPYLCIMGLAVFPVTRMPSSALFPFLGGLGSLINPFKQKRAPFLIPGYWATQVSTLFMAMSLWPQLVPWPLLPWFCVLTLELQLPNSRREAILIPSLLRMPGQLVAQVPQASISSVQNCMFVLLAQSPKLSKRTTQSPEP